jgi:hypothetical protein
LIPAEEFPAFTEGFSPQTPSPSVTSVTSVRCFPPFA